MRAVMGLLSPPRQPVPFHPGNDRPTMGGGNEGQFVSALGARTAHLRLHGFTLETTVL